MSSTVTNKRIGVTEIGARKGTAEPLVCLTAYTAPMARFLDPHTDLLLVGDSLGMVLYGMDTTLDVSVDMMINHGKAVMRGSSRSMVVVDMPFGSYQESPTQAFANAARIMKETGCGAVKLEGGVEMAETISFLTQRGIPVMGHIGLTPQSFHTMGGFKAQGRDDEKASAICRDAVAVSKAGAFSVVIEGTMEALARRITGDIHIPTIGIGASPACDGQVLVTEDMLGLFGPFKPKFVKRYVDLSVEVDKAAASYAADVRARTFPSAEYCFGMNVTTTGEKKS